MQGATFLPGPGVHFFSIGMAGEGWPMQPAPPDLQFATPVIPILERKPQNRRGGPGATVPAPAILELLRDSMRAGRVVEVLGLDGMAGAVCSTALRGFGRTHFPSAVLYG